MTRTPQKIKSEIKHVIFEIMNILLLSYELTNRTSTNFSEANYWYYAGFRLFELEVG